MKSTIHLWQTVFAFTAAMVLSNSAYSQQSSAEAFKQVTFKSGDGLKITADLYMKHEDKSKPFIILCHQAGWSRGEYREIAPKLNELGFNCLAIDQRSGSAVNGVTNQTAALATTAKKPTTFVDAEQDMIAALNFARDSYTSGKLILWGSSYSAALTLKIAGEHTDKVDGAMAFAPGEYFGRFGKPDDWIQTSAKNITCPVFITSAKKEKSSWDKIYTVITPNTKTRFLPETAGNHGSRALWDEFNDSKAYWKAVKSFLTNFNQR